jgi:hypothetical protein
MRRCKAKVLKHTRAEGACRAILSSRRGRGAPIKFNDLIDTGIVSQTYPPTTYKGEGQP